MTTKPQQPGERMSNKVSELENNLAQYAEEQAMEKRHQSKQPGAEREGLEPQVGDEVLVRGVITRIENGAMQIRLHGLGFPLMTVVAAELDHYGKTVLAALSGAREQPQRILGDIETKADAQ